MHRCGNRNKWHTPLLIKTKTSLSYVKEGVSCVYSFLNDFAGKGSSRPLREEGDPKTETMTNRFLSASYMNTTSLCII